VQFRCPICACSEYQRIVVPRAHGAPYETEFFTCLGCSVMFAEPELLTAAQEFRKEHRVAADAVEDYGPNSGAPTDALRSQALRYRYWKAKTKRERGGYEPTSEDIVRMRERYRQ
jgi:hypothetical protein